MDSNLRHYEPTGVRWTFIVWVHSLCATRHKVLPKVHDSTEIIMFDKSKYWYMIPCWVWKRTSATLDEGYQKKVMIFIALLELGYGSLNDHIHVVIIITKWKKKLVCLKHIYCPGQCLKKQCKHNYTDKNTVF